MNNRWLEILAAICDLPTAPYREQHVIAWLLAWAAGRGPAIRTRRDRAGNVYLEYRRGAARKNPLIIEAHMDHPGFVATRQKRDGSVEAIFRGGVKPSHFKGAAARFWVPAETITEKIAGKKKLSLPAAPSGRWVRAAVREVKTIRNQRHMQAYFLPVKDRVPVDAVGMWDLPDGKVTGNLFAARVCDDLAGVAAMVCMLEELQAKKTKGHVIGLCSRAEEVGFAGVLAICENGWIPKQSPVIGLETSKASAAAPQGEGPVIRVGDRTGIFSAGLTHHLAQAAGRIADGDGAYKFQRKLMDGGTCSTTAFAAYGYDAAGICLALGNYHNMTTKGEAGYRAAGTSKAGPGIASETIDTRDFIGMVRLLVQVAAGIEHYVPGSGVIRERLSKMHISEQKPLLYGPHD